MNGFKHPEELGNGPKGGDPIVKLVIDYPSKALHTSKQDAMQKLQQALHDCKKPLPLDGNTSWSCLDWSQITLNDTPGNTHSLLHQQVPSPKSEPSSCPVNVKAYTGLSFMPHTTAEKDTLPLFASGIQQCVCQVFTVEHNEQINVEIFRNGVERYPKEVNP